MASHIHLPADEGNDDKELIAIYENLLQYFTPFGYSRRQLVEAIKEANVGPQLNDFNVNRLLEFLSFQNEVKFEEKDTTPKNVEAESDKGNSVSLEQQCSSGSLRNSVPILHDKAESFECAIASDVSAAIQDKNDSLANSFDQMIMQIKILGYSECEARQGIIKSNVSPFITDENINRVVEFIENHLQGEEDKNKTPSSGDSIKISITNKPIAHHTLPQIKPNPALSTSAKIRASHHNRLLLQDNYVTSTSSMISVARPAVHCDGFHSLPKKLDDLGEHKATKILQDSTVTTTHGNDSKPSPLISSDDTVNHHNVPANIPGDSPLMQDCSGDSKITSNAPTSLRSHSLNPTAVHVHKEEVEKSQSLPTIPSDVTDTPPCLSDPTVHITVSDHQPPPTNDAIKNNDKVLHSVSLEMDKSQDSVSEPAVNSNPLESTEADEIEKLRSRIVPFEENSKSEESSCHESCDADSESLNSYTLLSDPSVIVLEMPHDILQEKDADKYQSSSWSHLDESLPDSPSRKQLFATNSAEDAPQHVQVLSDPFLVSGSLVNSNQILVEIDENGMTTGPIMHLETNPAFEAPSKETEANTDDEKPTTSKVANDESLLHGNIGFVPYARDDSMSSSDYSTVDIYNYKGPFDVSGPQRLPSLPNPQPVAEKTTGETDGGEAKTKLVKITPAELKKQLSKEYMKKTQSEMQKFVTPVEEKLVLPENQEMVSIQKESESRSLSAEFRDLINRTRILGYSEERIIEAIIQTNVNPKVSDVSIGILSDYLDSSKPDDATKSEGGEVADIPPSITAITYHSDLPGALDNMTCTDGIVKPPAFVTSTPIHSAGEKQPSPNGLKSDIVETPVKAPTFELTADVPKCAEPGEPFPLSLQFSSNNSNNVRLQQCNALDLAIPILTQSFKDTPDRCSSLPVALNRDTKTLEPRSLQHALGSLDGMTVTRDTMPAYGHFADEHGGQAVVKDIVNRVVDSLPIGVESANRFKSNLPEIPLLEKEVLPPDEEIVGFVVTELVDVVVEQELVMDGLDRSKRNLQNEELSDEFSGLIFKVQKLGFSRSMVEKAIEATNVNPGVGDVSVGVIVDYLQHQSFGSTQSDTETVNFENDTIAEDEVELLVSEMIAYIVNNEAVDSTQQTSMDGLNHFIPLYWLAQQEIAAAKEKEKEKRKKSMKDPYHELVEKLGAHKYKKKAIRAAIEATNVSPVVNEENVSCLLEYLQLTVHKHDDLSEEKALEELEEFAEELPEIMNTMMVDGYSDIVKYFLEKRYSQLLPAEFKPLVSWIKSHYEDKEWSKSDIKQAILLTKVPPTQCEESLQQVTSFLTHKKPEVDEKVVMVVKLKIEGMLESKPDVVDDVTDFLMNEDFINECLVGDKGTDRLEVQSTAYGLLKMSDVLPDMLQFVQSYCFPPEEPEDESAESDGEPSIKIEYAPSDDVYHEEVIKQITEEEWNLAHQLRSICDANGKEENPEKSVPILHKLGKIYRLKSPDKIHLLRSAALFNAALVRIPKNADDDLVRLGNEIKEDLYELCKHVLYLSGAKQGNANLLDASERFFEEVKNMREKSRTCLSSLEKVNGENAFYQEDMDAFKAQLINIEQSHETFERKFDLIGDIMEKAFDPIKSFVEMVELLYEENPQIRTQEETKIQQMCEIQEGITQDYSYIMKQISSYCVEILGDPPCKFAQIGMGSLARREVTPYSDFENVILLEDGVEKNDEYSEIQEYFRWYSVIFQMILINFGETILPCLAIPSLNDFHKMGECWFFDAYSGNGISFDGTMPHACKSPLGWQHGTPNNPEVPKELIQSVGKMADFVDCEDKTDDFHLSDMLMCTCFVAGMPEVYESFQVLVKAKVASALDESLTDELFTTMAQDMVKFNGLKSFSNLLLSVKWNVKQVIYRATTIFIAALGRKHHLQSTSSFDIISELLAKDIIQPHVAHKLKYAIALACEIRLRVYLEKQRQDDWINSDELPLCDLMMLFDMIGVRSTYEYFSIVVYLNMCVGSILEHDEIIPQLPERGLFICLPHLLEYIVHCIDVSFKIGCKMLLSLGNLHLTQLFDEEDDDVVDIEAILKIVREKIDPNTSKQVVTSISEFGNFLTGQGLYVEALICGLVEIYLQLAFLEDQSFNLVKWSRNFIGNICETLTMLQDHWQTLYWIMEYGQATDEE